MEAALFEIIEAIKNLKENFEVYASVEGDERTMTKHEVALLFSNQLQGKSKDRLDALIRHLDEDGDGVVNFEECAKYMADFAMMCCI